VTDTALVRIRERESYAVTCTFPAVATSAALIDARNWPPLIHVVLRAEPFHCTTARLLK
jgi:hypothetical protein